MKTKEDLTTIAENMIARHPRCLEYGLKFFKKAVKALEDIEVLDEEAKEIGRIIVSLPRQKCDMRWMAVKK